MPHDRSVSHVLVTGGAGFIGSHIVDELLGLGIGVSVLDNLDRAAHGARPDYLNPGARYVWGDVRDASAWTDALAGVDAVCHQAGKVGLGVDFADAPDYVSHNDSGLAVGLGVLHSERFAGPIVLASSMVVYGEGRYRCADHGVVGAGPRQAADLEAGRFEPSCPVCGAALDAQEVPEDAPLLPRNVYAATKLHQEHLVECFARAHAVRATALRYHNVYGPRMPRNTPYAGVASIFRSAIEEGTAPQVTEDGRQRRNFVHVGDVAHANVLVLISDSGSECAGDNPTSHGSFAAFNIASPESRTVGEMALALATAFGVSPGDPQWPVITGAYRLGDVRHVFASPRLAETQLGFRAATTFDAGLREFATAALRAAVPGP